MVQLLVYLSSGKIKHLWYIIIPWFLLGFQVVGDPESLGTVSFTNLASKHLMVVSIYFNFTNRRAVVFLLFARSPLCKKICAQIKLRIIMQPPPVLQVWKTTIKKNQVRNLAHLFFSVFNPTLRNSINLGPKKPPKISRNTIPSTRLHRLCARTKNSWPNSRRDD